MLLGAEHRSLRDCCKLVPSLACNCFGSFDEGYFRRAQCPRKSMSISATATDAVKLSAPGQHDLFTIRSLPVAVGVSLAREAFLVACTIGCPRLLGSHAHVDLRQSAVSPAYTSASTDKTADYRVCFRRFALHNPTTAIRPPSSVFVLTSAAAAGKSYKEQKELERRARAGDSVGWNASFVRSDTVVDALADRLGVGKGDILDREEVGSPPGLPSNFCCPFVAQAWNAGRTPRGLRFLPCFCMSHLSIAVLLEIPIAM